MRHYDQSLNTSRRAQLYMFDTNDATDQRLAQATYLDKALLTEHLPNNYGQ